MVPGQWQFFPMGVPDRHRLVGSRADQCSTKQAQPAGSRNVLWRLVPVLGDKKDAWHCAAVGPVLLVIVNQMLVLRGAPGAVKVKTFQSRKIMEKSPVPDSVQHPFGVHRWDEVEDASGGPPGAPAAGCSLRSKGMHQQCLRIASYPYVLLGGRGGKCSQSDLCTLHRSAHVVLPGGECWRLGETSSSVEMRGSLGWGRIGTLESTKSTRRRQEPWPFPLSNPIKVMNTVGSRPALDPWTLGVPPFSQARRHGRTVAPVRAREFIRLDPSAPCVPGLAVSFVAMMMVVVQFSVRGERAREWARWESPTCSWTTRPRHLHMSPEPTPHQSSTTKAARAGEHPRYHHTTKIRE
ncbi:hypothetical protein QBC39DRAFT_344908 [Podospora conica]|nr:hypothetical protein QBC39DRAFT_344908 [Schizothecium conicum]